MLLTQNKPSISGLKGNPSFSIQPFPEGGKSKIVWIPDYEYWEEGNNIEQIHIPNSNNETVKFVKEINEFTRPSKTQSVNKTSKTQNHNDNYDDNDWENVIPLNIDLLNKLKPKVNPRLRSIRQEELKFNHTFQFNPTNDLIQPLEECKCLIDSISNSQT